MGRNQPLGNKPVSKAGRPHALKLGRLGKGYPCISKASGARLASAAAICLEERNHEVGVLVCVRGHCEITFSLHWPKTTDQLQREWADPQESTECGAVAISILLVDKITEYHVVERAYKTTGIDYWLGKKDGFLLQKAARLEVSGIRNGNEKQVESRVKAKLKQSEQSIGTGLPIVVVVVEFGEPSAFLVMR
jgi:hypothetical protein